MTSSPRAVVLADPPLVDEAVERLLHLVRTGVELVEEQAVGFVAGDVPGGQKRLFPSAVICGTPIRSSGASWLPSSETHGSPTSFANWATSADLPIPGGPQMKTGRTTATWSRKAGNCDCVSVTEALIARM